MANYNFYTDQKWGKASNYTLCLNSSKLGYDRCEKIIMECIWLWKYISKKLAICEILFPTKGKKGAFQDHAFFEASSIRKVDGKYCFAYSSEHNHDLCYAMADSPKGPFTYGGVLVDIGDLYLNGNEDETHASNYLGNPFFWTDGRLKLEEGEMTWRSG